MRLSEQLKQGHEPGDFGGCLEGYAERALKLERALFRLSIAVMMANGEDKESATIKTNGSIDKLSKANA